jgi:hypothetical protein
MGDEAPRSCYPGALAYGFWCKRAAIGMMTECNRSFRSKLCSSVGISTEKFIILCQLVCPGANPNLWKGSSARYVWELSLGERQIVFQEEVTKGKTAGAFKHLLIFKTKMTNEIDDRRITVSSEAAASIHDDGIVILNTRKGCLFTANRTGARIWRCIEQQLSFGAIAEKISSEYQIAQMIARDDTAHFLAELERHGLIERGVES